MSNRNKTINHGDIVVIKNEYKQRIGFLAEGFFKVNLIYNDETIRIYSLSRDCYYCVNAIILEKVDPLLIPLI